MPLHLRIDQEADLVITTAEGLVSIEDLQAHARKLVSTPNRPVREIVEFSDHVEFPVPTEAVRVMARLLNEEDANAAGSRLAMVAKSDTIFGMMRLFEAHRDHPSVAIRVFRDRDEALRWLDETRD